MPASPLAGQPAPPELLIDLDCSSPCAMAGLVGLKDRFRIAFGNDPDADRHGIVGPSVGRMDPNHDLAVAIRYLGTRRPDRPATAAIGKGATYNGIGWALPRLAGGEGAIETFPLPLGEVELAQLGPVPS